MTQGSTLEPVVLFDSNNNPLAVTNGVAVPATLVGIPAMGSDGATTRVILVDSSGRQVVVGAAAQGAPIAGNPVITGGTDGTNAQRTKLYTPSYMASTNGSVGTGVAVATVTSIAYLFHPAAVLERYEIYRIDISFGGGAGATSNVVARGAFITAEAAVPGGTSQTINPTDRADAALAAATVFRTGATGAPTRVAGDLMSFNSSGPGSNNYSWTPTSQGKPIVIRSGVAEGFEIRTVIVTALGTAQQVSITFYWIKL